MKRFLVFVIICIVTLSLGLTTYYFLRDNETILVTDSYFEVNLLDTFVVGVEYINKNPNTEVYFESLHPDVVEYNEVTKMFEARSGGRAVVQVTSNKSSFKPVVIEVVVGDGTSNAPFFVKSIEDLLLIGKENVYDRAGEATPNIQTFDKAYKLRADLDFSALTSLDPLLMANNNISPTVYENGIWLPIGYDKPAGEGFSGVFDFDGHIIYNMNIDQTQFTSGVVVNNAGLFATLEAKARVLNLNLSNVTITGEFNTIGAVVGVNHGTVERVRVTDGTITNTSLSGYAGGVVGRQEVVDVVLPYTEMVYSNVEVNATYVAAGIVAHNLGGVVVSSYTNATIIGEANTTIGGVVGVNEFKQVESVFYDAIIKDTYYYGTIDSESAQLGAIIGQNINENEITGINRIRGNYYTTEISGEIEAIGGMLNTEIDTDKIGVYNLPLANMQQPEYYYSYEYEQPGDETVSVYWMFKKTWDINPDVNYGLPTLNMDAPKINHNFAIITDDSSIKTLQDLLDIEDDMAGTYVLEADLDLSTMSSDWVPLGFHAVDGITPFTGTFMAAINPDTQQPFVIRNLFTQSSRPVAGLFAQIGANGIISGITLENVNIAAGQTTGTIAAINDGLIENVTVTSTNENYFITASNVEGDANVGGIVGINNKTITNATTNLYIKVNSLLNRKGNGGGIAGTNAGSILNSNSASTLTGITQENAYLGGIVGSNIGSLERVHYSGNITASTTSEKVFVGGLAGYLDVYGTISYSYVPSGMYQGYAVGGLVGVSRGMVTSSYVDVVNIKAHLAGGLAFNISQGTYSQTATQAFMAGLNDKSVKAGFAYFIEYHNETTYGKVQYSFSAATFDNVGENYAETEAPIRTAGFLVPRQAGYVENSIYYAGAATLKEQNFQSAFNTEFLIDEKDRKIVVNDEQVLGEDGFKVFKDAGFNDTYWIFEAGQYPVPKISEE